MLVSCLIKAQESDLVILSGKIIDSENKEALIGASILVKSGVGTVADLNGNYSIKLPKGEYNMVVSMIGYSNFKQRIKLVGNKILDINLENNVLTEVEVVADMAKIRETPVAFSSISATKIQEELGGRDISMIANTTPGAYASSSGGGSGDSRVTIRGFDQRNIAVMVDGVPVNDMENGAVYWSNWSGLSDITRSMQIQRGLGASKLAISSVGGTMNYITNGIEGKQQLTVKKEWGNNNHNLMALSYNSGIINNKWGFTLAGTYRTGDGYVEQTWTNQYSYFAKVQFMPNSRHIISVGVNGAPQTHGQRTTKVPISVYSKDMALKLGINYDSVMRIIKTSSKYSTLTQGDRSLQWNPDQAIVNGGTINDKTNFYHKPLININHFWKVSGNTTISSVLYASFGKGGGTSYSNSSAVGRDTLTGYGLIQNSYNSNSTVIDPRYSVSEHKSSLILRSSNNNHNWFGLLSTATTKLNEKIKLTYGLDVRYYKGIHTTTIYNLLGGDYYVESGLSINPNVDPSNTANFIKKKGDIMGANYLGLVKWGGLFFQGEFKKDKWSAFFTSTGSYTGFNRVDFYKPKDLVLADTTFNNTVGYNTVINYNGSVYDRNSAGIRDATTGWKWQLGYTLKGGANYNINDHHNAFVNVGVMQIPQKFTNVFTFSNEVAIDFRPQSITSYELGYGIKYNKINASVNAYYTTWGNQPQNTITIGEDSYNLNGIDLLYKGVEFEATYKPFKKLELEGIASFGDWRYNSGGTIIISDQNGIQQGTLDYDAKGVHVSNAAQTQVSIATRIKPFNGKFKWFYFKPRYTYFDKNYANFLPTDLKDKNKGRDSWKIPAFGTFDLNAGIDINAGKFKVNIYGTMVNALNTKYINDAQNNGAGIGFNAASATVFFGTGRTFIFGTKLSF